MFKTILRSLILTLFIGLVTISPIATAQSISSEGGEFPEIETTQADLGQVQPVEIYFFYGDGCPHCADEEEFFEGLLERYPNVTIHEFEVWKNEENRKLLNDIGSALGAKISGVPFTIVGNKYFSGYSSHETTGAMIEEIVAECTENYCEPLISGDSTEGGEAAFETDKVTVPIIGEVNLKGLSLPAITVILGVLDGFNPCAMWTLIFLISLLIGMEDKKRMWILGAAFIVASSFVYFLFMAAWLNLLIFLGFIVWVRILIGLLALLGGGYNLKEYMTNKEAACKVTKGDKRQKVFSKLKALTHEKSFWLALGGIILLAFAVNLVELICSAGLPAVFTQILALNDLAWWQHYAYLLLYILFFMIDDLFVFLVSMLTLQVTGLTTKYTRLSHLVGGLLMLAIGILMIFRPEWLMFG
jgi:thiol-disulfide isomerase/thioredoxin